MFWCMHREPEGRRAADAAKDLQRDAVLSFINRYFWVPQFALVAAVYLGGQWAADLGLRTSGLSWM